MGRTPNLQDRLFKYSVKDEQTNCWEWTGKIANGGYGVVWLGKGFPQTFRMAHRAMYELLRGPIPEGLTLDHLCRNRRCVNPDHLEPVTHQENMLRGQSPTLIQRRSGKCHNGHELTPENTYTSRTRPTMRVCRTCNREWQRKYWQAKKAATT